MADYIELKEGLSIKISDIEGVSRYDEVVSPELHSMVYTHHHQYTSTFPYETLVAILSQKEDEKVESTALLNGFIKQGGQHFAG